ncbi:MAG: nucleotidyltransferase [Bacteroidetes bacterium GWA2_30_7]|nr:MAG: nucleotidyltransferase [Bacteroidetes bacterium GWA2_30_7]
MEIIESNINHLQKLCKQYKVLRLYIFGSILTNRFSEKSDIDFLVDFDKINMLDYADNFFDFKYSLQDLFHRNIDLLETKAITNPYLKNNIDKTKQLIYG